MIMRRGVFAVKIDTKILGEIEVANESVIRFKEGLLGLEDFNDYVLLELPGNDKFFCLQSMEDSDLAFFVIRPWDFFPDYEADIPDSELSAMGITRPEHLSLYCILTVPEEIKHITANLLAPIVVGGEKNEGKQLVLAETEYKTKHRLFPEKGV